MICSAPGKVVLWGEYAVLAGAPAVVMAVDRYAKVDLTASGQGWQFSCRGFLTPGVQTRSASFNKTAASAMVAAVLAQWGYTELPRPFIISSDSTEFYSGHVKLGIGSSAAVCTATYTALAALLQKPTALEETILIHRKFQGGEGSGLDIAASWAGGLIRFQEGHSTCFDWPADILWRVIWTGTSTNTSVSLQNFGRWRAHADPAPLDALSEASRRLCQGPLSLQLLADYSKCLRAFDRATRQNIFTPQHDHLATIASAHGLVYKPCGAGGGDIGIAWGTDPAALERFQNAAVNAKFVPLNLETATHGVKVSA